jgi:hypothetical protein
MIEHVAEKSLEMLPVDFVVNELSTYGFRLTDYLERDQLIDRLKSILRIEERNGWRLIVVDEMIYAEMEQQYNDGHAIDRDTLLSLLGIETSINWARNNSAYTALGGKTVDEQLIDLNRFTRNDVEWLVNADRVVPNYIRAAVFSRLRLTDTLNFRKVRLEALTPAFETEFSLYTLRAVESRTAVSTTDDDQFQTQSITAETEVYQESLTETQTQKPAEAQSNQTTVESTQITEGATEEERSTVNRGPVGEDLQEIDEQHNAL